MALLPGGLIIYFSFTAGGYFPASTSLAAGFLAVVLGLRLLVARDLPQVLNRWFVAAGAAMALLAIWTLGSQIWSDAPARASIEFNRVLLYSLTLIVFGTAAAERRRVRWMLRGVALGMVVVIAVALISLVLPNFVPTTLTGLGDERLSYPVSYWNALGLIAGIGLILSVHFTKSRREAVAVRALAAAAVPIAASTLYFTLSRGAIAASIVGLTAYVVLARRDSLIPAIVSTAPTTAVALLASYDAELLSSIDRDTAAAAAQGSQLAKVLGACAIGALVIRLLLIPVERRLEGVRWPWSDPSREVKIAIWGGTAVAVVALALALGAPERLSTAYDEFVSGPPPATSATGDARERLTALSSSYRTDYWGIGMNAFGRDPLHGHGAGTFALLWDRDRPAPGIQSRNAHSLYVETLAELGVVGFALLMFAILTILAAMARRVRGSTRSVAAALLATGITWAIHAGVDWDWQLPATTVWFFALGGAVLASPIRSLEDGPRERRPSWRSISWRTPERLTQIGAAVACFALAVLPLRMTISQARLDASLDAFYRGDCPQAAGSARASLSTVARPEAHAVLGYCNIALGDERAGLAEMQRAVSLDRRNWEFQYALAQAQAAAGVDPRRAIRDALALNPLDPRVQEAERRLTSADSPAAWRKSAEAVSNITLNPGEGKSLLGRLDQPPAPTP